MAASAQVRSSTELSRRQSLYSFLEDGNFQGNMGLEGLEGLILGQAQELVGLCGLILKLRD